MKKAIISILFFALLFSVNAQENNDCAIKLKEAQDQYDIGVIEGIDSLISDCLENGFTREEKLQAYKLLINALIFDDDLPSAEKYMLSFLRKFPEYQIAATDPSEFVDLLNQFNNNPRSSIGIILGGNFGNVRVIEPVSLNGTKDAGAKYRNSGLGFQAGIIYNINLGSFIEISLEPMYVQSRFEYNAQPYTFADVEYTEKQDRIDFPVSCVFTFSKGKFVPYARLGAKAAYLLSASSNSQRTYVNTSEPLNPVTGSDIEIMDNRLNINYWAVLGGGLRYKIPGAYIFLDVRYNLGLQNQVNTDSRFDGNDDNTWLYLYRQDDFYLDDFSFSMGIAKTIYRPKRKK